MRACSRSPASRSANWCGRSSTAARSASCRSTSTPAAAPPAASVLRRRAAEARRQARSRLPRGQPQPAGDGLASHRLLPPAAGDPAGHAACAAGRPRRWRSLVTVAALSAAAARVLQARLGLQAALKTANRDLQNGRWRRAPRTTTRTVPRRWRPRCMSACRPRRRCARRRRNWYRPAEAGRARPAGDRHHARTQPARSAPCTLAGNSLGIPPARRPADRRRTASSATSPTRWAASSSR